MECIMCDRYGAIIKKTGHIVKVVYGHPRKDRDLCEGCAKDLDGFFDEELRKDDIARS